MTPAQKALYFRIWGACVKARGWNTAAGREADAAFFAAAPDISGLHTHVWQGAEALARQRGGEVTADDLRHGCHAVAGAPQSSSKFTNADVDRVLALFRLLTNTEDLEAMLAWQSPEVGEGKRLLSSLRKAPAAYVEAIASDKFGTRQWDSLPIDDLRQLALTVRLRLASRQARAAVPA